MHTERLKFNHYINQNFAHTVDLYKNGKVMRPYNKSFSKSFKSLKL